MMNKIKSFFTVRNTAVVIGCVILIYAILMQVLYSFNLVPDYTFYKIKPSKEQIDNFTVSTYFGKAAFLAYFTIQTNIIIGATWVGIHFIKNEQIKTRLFTITASYSLVLVIAYWTLLAPTMPWNSLRGDIDNMLLHAIIPICFIVYWWFSCPIPEKVGETILWSMIYPICYYLFAWIFYLSTNNHGVIYPFLNFYNPFTFNLTNVATIFLIDLIIFAFLLFLFTFGIWILIWLRKKTRLKKEIRTTSKTI